MEFEAISELHQRRDSLMEGHRSFIAEHPELKEMLNDFVAALLLEKPEDVRGYAKSYFARFGEAAGEAAEGKEAAEDGPAPLVITGPSGVGKGTLIKRLMEAFPDKFGFSVSHTTRGPRPGEVDGVDYCFTTVDKIKEEIEAGAFIEHAIVHDNYYGTSFEGVRSVRSSGRICILDIDVQGARAVRSSDLHAHLLFIAPPSMEELEARLRGRGTESEEAILTRLGNAHGEVEFGTTEGNFDAVVVNGDLDVALDDLKARLAEFYPGFGFD